MTALSLKQRLAADHAAIPQKLTQWAAAQDELTLRINEIAARNASFYLRKGLKPESGRVDEFSSLVYPSPEAARDEFAKHNPHVYGRNGGPRLTQLADILKLFDPCIAEARITNWGMGAVAAALYPLKKGDHVVASKFLFGGCYVLIDDLRTQRGVKVSFIDGTKPDEWENAVRPNTKLFWFETPGNPTGKLIDIRAVAEIAHAKGRDILVAVDNSLAFSAHAPLRDGADLVAASLTKALGLGRRGGGALLFSEAGIQRHQRHIGDATGTRNVCFDAIAKIGATPANGAAVLPLIAMARNLPGRVTQQVETADRLARHLTELAAGFGFTVNHPTLDKPHRQMTGVSVFSVDLGSEDRAFALIKELGRHGIAQINNFGGLKTAVTHPASTTHSSLTPKLQAQQGVTPGLLRITAGIESAELVLKIFDAALSALPPMAATRARRTVNRQLAA